MGTPTAGPICTPSDALRTGCSPAERVFEAETAMQVLVQHVYGTPTPLSERVPQPIPPELDALVMSCLQKDPANRPQTADALADALAVLALGVPVAAGSGPCLVAGKVPSGTEPFATDRPERGQGCPIRLPEPVPVQARILGKGPRPRSATAPAACCGSR